MTKSYPAIQFGHARVIDDFMPAPLHKELLQFFSEPIWFYGWKSNSKKEHIPNGHWNVFFAGYMQGEGEHNCEAELAENEFFAPIDALWQRLKAGPLAGHEPVRVYANAHTYGTDGYAHIDSEQPNYFSTVCYLHPEWKADWAGETVFFNSERDDVTQAVFPRPGRIVSFYGAIPHAARAPSRDCPALRVCLVFKTRLRAA